MSNHRVSETVSGGSRELTSHLRQSQVICSRDPPGGSREQSSCLCLSLVGLVSNHRVSVCSGGSRETDIVTLSVSGGSRDRQSLSVSCLCPTS